eukprot:5325515-Amphidinium_carterae.1
MGFNTLFACATGRILIPRSAEMSPVAWFTFCDLCDKPLGAADYLCIGQAFPTVFLSNIPRLTMQDTGHETVP